MAGRRELWIPKASASSLKEQAARTILRIVKSQGHTYIDLREDGKKFVFYCTLCITSCYSDTILFQHLNGKDHRERYVAAKTTLLKPNPWPFNDGFHFFHDSCKESNDSPSTDSSRSRLLDRISLLDDENNLAIVNVKNSAPGGNGHVSEKNSDSLQGDEDDGSSCDANIYDIIIPGVLVKGELSVLGVRLVGVGRISARLHVKEGVSNEISKIWCEWLGKKDDGDEDEDVGMIPEHDFAVVTFPYNYELGRTGVLDDVNLLLSSSHSEIEVNDAFANKKRKALSDPGCISESLSNQNDSSGEETQSSNSRSMLKGQDDQIVHSKCMSSKTRRKELRKQQRVAADRKCDICKHNILKDKDVAALLNQETGKLACSSRNVNGAFHVYHVSCLIHWILLRESEIHEYQLAFQEVRRKSKKKGRSKSSDRGKTGESEATTTSSQFNSVFCMECQGTGINVEGDELEPPTISLSQMYRYQLKVVEAHKAWMRSPEVLQNCSTGIHFPSQSEDVYQETVLPLKLLNFYCADV